MDIDFHRLIVYDIIAKYGCLVKRKTEQALLKNFYERGYTIMAKLDLTKYGISGTTEIIHNPSYEELFVAETDPALTG